MSTAEARRLALWLSVGVAGLIVGFWALERVRGLLVLVLFSFFCAFALEPAVAVLARRGWSRGQATLAVYGVIALVLAAAGATLGVLLVRQVTGLIDSLPGYLQSVADYVQRNTELDLSDADVAKTAGTVGRIASTVAGGAFGFGATLAGLLFQLLTVATLTFYFVKDGPRMRRAVCSLLPPARQHQVLFAWEVAMQRTASYIYYRFILATLSTGVHWLALSLLDVPYPLILAIFVGVVSQFVPTVGTYLAGALPIAVALAVDPQTAVWTLLFILFYQQLENYVISPPLSARTMRIHPAVGFISAIGGVLLLGPIGALLALPIVATVQTIVAEALPRHPIVDTPMTDPAGPDALPQEG